MSLLKYGGITLCDGVKSGILNVELIPDIVVPGRRRQQIQIPGRNGDIVLYDGAYNNVIRRYNVYFSKNYASSDATLLEAIRSALESVLNLRGYNVLADAYMTKDIGNKDNYYYYAELLSDINIVNTFMRYGRCVLEFNCKPFAYLSNALSFALIKDSWSEGHTLKKEGNAYSCPLFTFYNPSGTFFVNILDGVAGRYHLDIYNMPTMKTAVLDCENLTFTGEDEYGLPTNLFQYLEWRYIPSLSTFENYGVQLPRFYGDWEMTVTTPNSTLSMITIEPRWRNII